MPKRRQQYDRTFKLAAISRMEEAISVAALAAELGVRRELLHKWRRTFERGGAEALVSAGRRPPRATAWRREGAASLDPAEETGSPERRIAELERLVGQQQRDLDFFRAALQHVRDQRRKTGGSGGGASTP